ncbi:uncharacterized protein N7477_003835 [Penicillium maclennaniae]|uniref:uncharacterized protein n=1 Tax=Penicillium maclennaniae TaxID=1343394 RepID=UPI002541375E|nr:uncharacterized protein N7477_003835 [Penicillium maclennaniae]KAJ5678202.1 hypothetical protein N7477_003835 [Penicillium maclennaniae]
MEDSSTMETESRHEGEFPHSPWVELGAFTSPQHSPPMPEYSGFDYHPSMMAVDGPYNMSIPPALRLDATTHALAFVAQHAYQPIPISRKWYATCVCPDFRFALGPDADRRNMCLYHEENKTAKQTDIGALFGVERSTVSKVLRQKEKYLNPDDGGRSPIKRTKGRVPDIEKALVNWARNYQRLGQPLNDEMIREKALFFASNCGCPEGKEKVLTASWLEKFKQKNGLLGAKVRKGSTGIRSGSNSPTRINTDCASSASHSPCSPPNGLASPLSPGQSHHIKKEADAVPDLTGGYQHGHPKSTTALDTSTGMTSPTSTMVSDSPFTPTSQARLPTGHNMSRPRSQTFTLGIPIDPNLLTADESMDSQCTKTEGDAHLGVAILESPLEMDDHQARTIKGVHPPTVIKRNRSNPEIKTTSMQPPPSVSKSTTTSPISAGGTPNSPTQDEVRSALELVMTYFQHQPAGLEAQEFISIGKLMERLELAKSHQSTLLGGLTRIDEHDDVPRVSKKRSIHNLG